MTTENKGRGGPRHNSGRKQKAPGGLSSRLLLGLTDDEKQTLGRLTKAWVQEEPDERRGKTRQDYLRQLLAQADIQSRII